MSFLTARSEYPENDQQGSILVYKIKWLIIFRMGLVTILLGSALVLQTKINRTRLLDLLYLFIIVSYIFSAITIPFLKRISNVRLYAYFQIVYDLLFETGIVYITGGIESIFTFTYIFTIITASILLLRRGAFIAASLSTILYGTLVDLQFYQILPPVSISLQIPFTIVNSSTIYYNIFLNSCAFYLVAFLSSYLSESLRRAHQRLRETSHDLTELQSFHQNILQSMHSGLLTTDLQGKITSYNSAAELMTGYKLNEVYGKDLHEVFPQIDPVQLFQSLSNADKRVYRLETTISPKGGDSRILHFGVSVSLLRDNNLKVTGLIFIFQDLTERKEMQERIARSERLAAIGQLAAGVAHEIRNPLASISGAIQMLKTESGLSEDNQALMEIILRESGRLDTVLTDFLLYARPKTMTFVKCDLVYEVIVPTMGLLKTDLRFPTEKIQIQIDSTPNLPKIVCDVQQMKQVFWNLFLNALQAMPDGGILTVNTRIGKWEDWRPYSKVQSPGYVGVITVCDTGNGIAEEHLRLIFHPFYTTKKHGTGLGLAIAHSIVENHHGIINVQSAVNKGTKFEVILPLKQEYW